MQRALPSVSPTILIHVPATATARHDFLVAIQMDWFLALFLFSFFLEQIIDPPIDRLVNDDRLRACQFRKRDLLVAPFPALRDY